MRMRLFFLLLTVGLLLGCYPKGDPAQPIPTALVAAPQSASKPTTLVVVLPGRGDDLDGLRKAGIAEAIQSAWPDADVMLTGLALSYYTARRAETRLHAEVIEPARARGYSSIWLVGASLGGMGSVMYDRAYPGVVDGIVLLAPYLGDKEILRSIEGAGGVAAWEPPPMRDTIDSDNFQIELWRHIKRWSAEPSRARNVWLAYGDRDGFADSIALLAPALRPQQVRVRKGGHTWAVWAPATRDALMQARADGRAR